MVHNLDESIGLLLEAYDTMGLAENTYLSLPQTTEACLLCQFKSTKANPTRRG